MVINIIKSSKAEVNLSRAVHERVLNRNLFLTNSRFIQEVRQRVLVLAFAVKQFWI